MVRRESPQLSRAPSSDPAQLGPVQLGPGQLGPGQLGPGQLGPGQLRSIHIKLTKTTLEITTDAAMRAYTTHTGLVVPLDRADVDTDQIIPKQFLKRIERTGFGQYLFYDWRFLEDGTTPNPEFVLNHSRYADASVLLARQNFGCGSSREHAPWALDDFGFRVIIAPSFADIFYNNCFKNGLLPVVLESSLVVELFQRVQQTEGYRLTVDLPSQTISDARGWTATFPIDPFRKECLLGGLDDIGLTLQHAEKIAAYEQAHQITSC